MSYLQTSATDYNDLLDKLVTFAVADGWTQSFNSAGPPRQIGIYKGNCHVALGARSGENPIAKGSQNDAIVNAALSTSLTPGTTQYWGHPGSLVTTSTDSDRIQWNDLYGSLTNVWFFSGDGVSDPDYIHVIVQAGGERYTHFSIGILDPIGQTHPDVAFACGGIYEWWDTSTNCHRPENAAHEFGHLGGEGYGQIRIVALTLPSGYPTAAVYRVDQYITAIMTRVASNDDHWDQSSSENHLMDFFYPVANELTTGGNSLFSLPWMFREDLAGTSHVWLGRLPGIRLANIAQHAPATVLTQGTDEWVIFPWKRKGLKENLATGGDPIQECNTADYAWAFKKSV